MLNTSNIEEIESELLNQYTREVEVQFKEEKYLVRDNGTVYRIQRSGKRKRPLDEKWTFGKQEPTSGYMSLNSHRVHRIVAFAFHGNPPTTEHVVDHIDTNKCNNRPENLRWVTRLENVILNPITLKRIIVVWGSLEKFFENPRSASRLEPNLDWMRSVTKEDAERCKEQLLKWAESDTLPKGGNLTEWVYSTRQSGPSVSFSLDDKQSLTPIAIQRLWKWPSEFPKCPNRLGSDPLEQYVRNLSHGSIFTRNKYGESSVVMVEKNDEFISVISVDKNEGTVKPWSVAKVTFEDGKFVHENIGLFFELNGAKRAYYELLDIPFLGESIDDYM